MNYVLCALVVAAVLAAPHVHTTRASDGSSVVYPDPLDNTPQCTRDGRLCIGTWFAATNAPHLRAIGVTHIVSAIGEPADGRLAGIDYLVLTLDDTRSQDMADAFARSHEFIARAHAGGGNVLVHCAAGVSRSAALVIHHWQATHGWTYEHALAELRAVRSVVNPNTGFARQLGAHPWPELPDRRHSH